MCDIFISYSRKDSEQALQLAELLQSAGLSCWIDRQGIEPAANWSAEIVTAIDNCKAFIVLLSRGSAASHNVAKELALAGERQKKILPIDLEPIQLPREFAYQLAGIQRSPMTNIDSIIRALSKLGLVATSAPVPPRIVRSNDDRKSLMILPFEDLSPTQDNGWFADGIASELISALTGIKSLRLTDAQTAKSFKRYQGTLANYAREMSIRYFVQGDVRKFGDNIKISARLLDIESGEHLWQDMLKGTMNDVFDLQEEMATKVVEGLKLHLASDEKEKLAERGTENAEAYELFLKAREYHNRATYQGIRLALQTLGEALNFDPSYARAIRFKAYCLTQIYRLYKRDPALLVEAEQLLARALKIQPDDAHIRSLGSMLYMLQGKLDDAEEAAKQYVRQRPQDFDSHLVLGTFYVQTNRHAEAIPHLERALELGPDNLDSYFSILIAAENVNDSERVRKWSNLALPLYERDLRLAPDNAYRRVEYADLLAYAGQPDRARKALEPLTDNTDLDALTLYNVSCLHCRLGEVRQSLTSLRLLVAAEFSNIELIRTDPELAPIRDLPEFQELLAQLEAKQKHANV